jgi:hypothetical protein
MPRVRAVIAASTALGSINRSSCRSSTKTGRAPQ